MTIPGEPCPSVHAHFPNLPATPAPLGIKLTRPAKPPVGAIGERPLSHERASHQSKRCGLCGSIEHKAWRCPKNAKRAVTVEDCPNDGHQPDECPTGQCRQKP